MYVLYLYCTMLNAEDIFQKWILHMYVQYLYCNNPQYKYCTNVLHIFPVLY